jgi:Phage tail lysozyme
MAQSIGELFVKLGFDVDDSKLKSFQDSVQSVYSGIKDLAGAAGIGLGVAGFTAMLNSAADAAIQVRNLNTELGISKESARSFAAAWHGFNPNTDPLTGLSVAQSVGRYINAAQYGQRNEGVLLGLTGAEKTLEEVNEKVRANFQASVNRWGISKVTEAMQAIYGTADAVNVLSRSTQEYNEAAKKGIISDEAQKNLEDYDTSIADLSNSLNQLKVTWLAMPAKEISDFLKSPDAQAHPGLVGGGGLLAGAGIIAGGIKGAFFDLMAIGGWAVGQDIGKNLKDKGYAWNPAIATFPGLPGNTAPFGFYKRKDYSGVESQLRGMGWDDDHIAAAMRRLNAESGLNPDQYGHGKEAKGMPDEAYGAAQWHPDRQKEFARIMGRDIHGSSLEDQIYFMNYELTKGNERNAGNKFFSSKGADNAYASFTNDYERPAVTVSITNNFDGSENPQYHADVVNQQVINNTFAITSHGGY